MQYSPFDKSGGVLHIPRPMAVLSILLTVLLVAASVLIVLLVLVQRPKQEGLGAAFGGGTLDSALGAHTTDVLQKITTYLAVIFFVSAIGLAMVKTRQYRASAASDVMEKVEESDSEGPAIPPELQRLIDGEGADPAPAAPEGGDPAGNDPASLLPETRGLDAPAEEGAAPAKEEEGDTPAPGKEGAPTAEEAASEKAGAGEKAGAEPAPEAGEKKQSGAGSKEQTAPNAQGEPEAKE